MSSDASGVTAPFLPPPPPSPFSPQMCVRVEEVAALLETQLAGMAAMMTMGAAGSKRGPSAGASQSMLLDEGEDEDDGYGYGGSAGAMDEDM